MSFKKRIGLGVTLHCDPAGGSSWTEIAKVVEGIDGSAKATIVPTPLLGEKYLEKTKAGIDGGQRTLTIAWDPDHDQSQLLSDMFDNNETCPNWKITIPGATAAAETFRAWVSDLGRTIKREEYLVATVTLDVSGSPGFGGTP